MKRQTLVLLTTVIAVCCASRFNAAQAPRSESDLPVVKTAEMPMYPHIARVARIEGTVRLQVWTDGASVVRVEGTGNKLLANSAEQNVRTWRFYPHKATSFTITFVYGLDKTEVDGYANPSIAVRLPTSVEIRTSTLPIETETSH